MKRIFDPPRLPWLIPALGIAALIARLGIYLTATDAKGLLRTGTPLEWLLWLVCIAGAALILTVIPQLDGSAVYEDNFGPSPAAAVGCGALAVGIAATVLLMEPGIPGIPALVWKFTGGLSAAASILLAWLRLKGQKPFFLLYGLVCVFLAMHTLYLYRPWSSCPQMMDFFFDVCACVGLTLFGYCQTAFPVGLGKRRMQLAAGLAAGFFCFACLYGTDYLPLYLGGGIWALTDLCALTPIPKRTEPAPEAPGDADTE